MSILQELLSLTEAKVPKLGERGSVAVFDEDGLNKSAYDVVYAYKDARDAQAMAKYLKGVYDGSDTAVETDKTMNDMHMVWAVDYSSASGNIMWLYWGATKAEARKLTKAAVDADDIYGMDADGFNDVEFLNTQG